MRYAILAIMLLGCASGRSSGDTVDATDGSDTGPAPDSGCGALPCDGIYVANNGNDSAAGTKQAPLKTITAGIAKAAATTPPQAVFVKAGTYTEVISMRPGVTLYGGFDDAWMRNASVTTEIDGPSPAVRFDAITVATALDTFTIKSADAVAPGDSSIAVLAIGGSKLIELRDVTVLPGIGAAGADGADGTIGASGGAGTAGGPGVEHSTAFLCDNHTLPVGGAGGTSVCGRTGGRGGAPGVASSGGSSGLAGLGGTSGGAGAPGESQDGSGGGTGGAGNPGNSGLGGLDIGMFVGATYMPARGSGGVAGGAGNGGGGGGGGGGGTTDCDSSGSSGGGGGAGGCGGTPGTPGDGGGGSFGIVAVDSSIAVKSSIVTANHGGAGGRGGRGGLGGTGGAGGAGGPYGGSSEQDDGGFGAAGGRGGNGGAGGNGGGGGGGPSAALVCVGTGTISLPQSTATGGTPGAGGSSLGNPGAIGVATRSIGCSFF
jgi:hypothetical protein